MDPREQPFADIINPMDFAGDDTLLEGEVVDEEAIEPAAPEQEQLNIASLMQEAFGGF